MGPNDMRGLSQDLNRQTRKARKSGGPSEALRRMKRRPENKDWRLNALHNRKTQSQCDECEATATVSSILNGELEYQLCGKCFLKRNVQSKKIR